MIWLDLDNTPHVPLFRPILVELERHSAHCFVTSRRHAQTEDLLNLWRIPHLTLGAHGGGSTVGKLANLLLRSGQLARAAWGKPITLAVSHGSRTHMVAARLLGIPYLVMDDYEYSEQHLARYLTTYMLFPAHIPDERLAGLGIPMRKVIRYQGFKEQVYLKDFVPAPGFRGMIGVDQETVLITMRPPSLAANYHDDKSEQLFSETLNGLSSQPGTLCLIVNRTEAERRLIPERLVEAGSVRFLDKPVDGLQLLWNSDLVVSGGGTMNREAALLGVPTYSVFAGRRPAADEQLEREGCLTFIESPEQARRLTAAKRNIGTTFTPTNTGLAAWIAELILELANQSRSQ